MVMSDEESAPALPAWEEARLTRRAAWTAAVCALGTLALWGLVALIGG